MLAASAGVTEWTALAGPAVGAILGFLLGLLAFSINEYRKARREKDALAVLFADHIADVWSEVDALKSAPIGQYFARVKASALGVGGLAFFGEPEYRFEVDDVGLWDTHGVKLATILAARARKQFWFCYRLLRKTEAVRHTILELSADAKDRSEYQKLFQQLVSSYGAEMLKLHRLLLRERGWWHVVGYPTA